MNCLQAMAERFHPIGERRQFANVNNLSKKSVQWLLGEYRKNVKYKDVYEWFNCMQVLWSDGEEDNAFNDHDGNDDGNDG